MNINHNSLLKLVVLFFVIIYSIPLHSDSTADPILTGDAGRGQDLFTGRLRFTNNGPSCNFCHNVSIDGVMSGGTLAKDLTQCISRLTAVGAKSFYGNTPMPMPQMQESYADKPLTKQEVEDISAFLLHADNLSKNKSASYTGGAMLFWGIGGVAFLMFVFTSLWIKRKKGTVNIDIYKRQMRSVDY
ncbi:MAG: c-type cytochrome [Saprospiraceae bacterium]|nr:c-type cytochrome [Saprospiraceae bacterium]